MAGIGKIEKENKMSEDWVAKMNEARKVILTNVINYSEQNVAIGLKSLSNVQIGVSDLVGAIPSDGELPTGDQLRTYFLALMVETTELMNELNWKPWKKTQKEIDKPKVCDEFADILAFLGIITVYLESFGITSEELAAAYTKKSKVNVERFFSGY